MCLPIPVVPAAFLDLLAPTTHLLLPVDLLLSMHVFLPCLDQKHYATYSNLLQDGAFS